MGTTSSHDGSPKWTPVAERIPVTLNVYDVEVSCEIFVLNRALRPLGSGAFHVGVEVIGREWSFQGTKAAITGVFCSRPRECDGYHYVESVPMGLTRLSEGAILKLIETLEAEWPGRKYNPMYNNCAHFCQRLCELLGVCNCMPKWVIQLAATGRDLVEIKDHAKAAIDEMGCV
mmetsp:Transcript_102203/g.256246  ORF Transcript_102203/g.256246 Transcript_102203/m.256246 type:complete len:174 (-) Transcript_102203:184-705(-)